MSSRTFLAEFPGVCAECGDDIEVDDPIKMTDDGPVHEECDPDALPIL